MYKELTGIYREVKMEEIDIQSIHELLGYEECTTRGDIIEKINEIIKALKQIDERDTEWRAKYIIELSKRGENV